MSDTNPEGQKSIDRKSNSDPRSQISKTVLEMEFFSAGGKNFICTLNENQRGRFVRITEEFPGHKTDVLIPEEGLRELRSILDSLIAKASKLPAISSPPPRKVTTQ